MKLFWDFFGPNAERTGRHFERHLRDFLERNGLGEVSTDVVVDDGLTAVSCTPPEHARDAIVRALRPRRAEE